MDTDFFANFGLGFWFYRPVSILRANQFAE